MTIRHTLLLTLLAASPVSHAVENTDFAMNSSWLSLSVSRFTLDDAAAAGEFVEAEAVSLNVDFEAVFANQLSAKAGLGLLTYDDNAEFSQYTEDVFGDVDSSSSEATAIPVYVAGGYTQHSTGAWPIYWSAQGGYLYNFASERSIPNCSDCESQDIDIGGGPFVSFAGGFILSDRWKVGVYIDRFLSGDMDSSMGLRISLGSFATQPSGYTPPAQSSVITPVTVPAVAAPAPQPAPAPKPAATALPAPEPAPAPREQTPADKPGGNLWSPNALDM